MVETLTRAQAQEQLDRFQEWASWLTGLRPRATTTTQASKHHEHGHQTEAGEFDPDEVCRALAHHALRALHDAVAAVSNAP